MLCFPNVGTRCPQAARCLTTLLNVFRALMNSSWHTRKRPSCNNKTTISCSGHSSPPYLEKAEGQKSPPLIARKHKALRLHPALVPAVAAPAVILKQLRQTLIRRLTLLSRQIATLRAALAGIGITAIEVAGVCQARTPMPYAQTNQSNESVVAGDGRTSSQTATVTIKTVAVPMLRADQYQQMEVV